jgi:ubiquinone/menaquinone biosynthesis C-methylase UbiE
MSEPEFDELLWSKFAEARMKGGNLNDHLDLPSVFQAIPPGNGSKALDLGCGLGQSSFLLAEKLGYDVLAVDASEEMLGHAQKLYAGNKIRWIPSKFENLELSTNSVQLIVACLSFHFVEELDRLLRRCVNWLCDGGILVFSVRHPIRTCDPTGEVDLKGQVAWIVKDYFHEGVREFDWLGTKCLNFHRPFSTYVKMITDSGLILEKVLEPSDPLGASSSSLESRSVPFFLTLTCRKPSGT